MKSSISKYFISLVFFILTSNFLNANPVDSLLNLVDEAKNDSIKFDLYIQLSKQYLPGDTNNTIYFEKAFGIAKKMENPYIKATAYFYKGTSCNYYAKYDSSVFYFEQAIEYFEVVQDTFYLVATWGELGNMYCFRGKYEECVECFLESLKHAELYGNDSYIGVLMNNIGSAYYLLEDYEEAMKYYLEAYSVYTQMPSEYGIALSANNIGSAYLEYYEEYDSAYKYLKIAEEYSTKINFYEQLAETTTNLAQLFSTQGNFSKAKEYNIKSIDLNKKIENQRGLIHSYISFAMLYFNEDLYQNAKIYADSCIVLSQKIGTLEYEAEGVEMKYRCDSAIGNYQGAFLGLQKYVSLHDSLAKSEAQENIKTLQAEFEVERQEKENQLLLEKQEKQDLIIQRQRLYSIFVTVALALFIGLLVLLFSVLRQRKRHFEILYAKNQEIMQQKEEIMTQNEILNVRNEEIKTQNEEIAEQRNVLQKYQTNIQASINYAKRIQAAVMPAIHELSEVYSDVSLVYMPRDIISGDFFFFKKFENKSFLTVADCTGHGVPGALMSILNLTLLKEVLRDSADMTAAETLNQVRYLVKSVLKQTSDMRTVHDGMDAAMIIYDENEQKLNYSGANNPLYYIHNNELNIIKADRQPVSAHIRELPFTDNYIDVQQGDVFYMFSDGYYDQISKDLSSKFGIKKFKEIILESNHLPLEEQKKIFIDEHKKWSDGARQTDDIIILAFKI